MDVPEFSFRDLKKLIGLVGADISTQSIGSRAEDEKLLAKLGVLYATKNRDEPSRRKSR